MGSCRASAITCALLRLLQSSARPRADLHELATGPLTGAGLRLCFRPSALFFNSPPSLLPPSPPGDGAAATGRARCAARYRCVGRAGRRGSHAVQAEGRAQAACIGRA